MRDRIALGVTVGTCVVMLTALIYAVTGTMIATIVFLAANALLLPRYLTTPRPVSIFYGTFSTAAIAILGWVVSRALFH